MEHAITYYLQLTFYCEIIIDSEESRVSLVAQMKESACNVGDPGSVPGLGRSPGEGNGNSLQYPCLRNLMDREVWWATVPGVAKELEMTWQLKQQND